METPLHHLARDGRVIGQHSLDEMRAGLASGRFRETDHVWASGQARWVTLGELLRPAGAAAGAEAGPGFLGRAFAGIGVALKWVFVIGFGLFLGMLLQSGGRNPNRQGDGDPLRDPYAGGRDPDFDDPDRGA